MGGAGHVSRRKMTTERRRGLRWWVCSPGTAASMIGKEKGTALGLCLLGGRKRLDS